ncbi:MAG: prealbumin-like fold domain-containing protein [Clostridiales bacterium]|jgi:hypothetical protein|nr:prealbumin-like fold domain-containing protein [Clostridiales bacterium]
MELYKLENKKFIAAAMVLIAVFLVFSSHFAVKADNGWLTETPDGYYDIGNNLEVKLDILNSNKEPVGDNSNFFYNGQNVYIKLDWRTVDIVEKSTSLEIKLPVGRLNSQISFESPLFRNVEVVSEDSKILTSLKADGSTITTFFMADSPIVQGKEGTILIPHNIFVSPDADKFSFSTLEFILTTDNGQKKYVRKEVNGISDGLLVNNFSLKDKANGQNIESFATQDNNDAALTFNYQSGSKGISAGDSILLKFNGFSNEKNAKIKPYAFEMIDIFDDSGAKVGYIMFLDSSNGDTYMRVVFNNAFEGKGKVTGHINVLTDVSFAELTDGESILGITANNIENTLTVRGPGGGAGTLEYRFSNDLGGGIIRKISVINEADVLTQQQSPELPLNLHRGYKLSEVVTEPGYSIDENSIRVIKFLSKTSGKSGEATSYGLDSAMLKNSSSEGYNISIGSPGFEGQSGMNIQEFEAYIGKEGIYSPEENESGAIIGFSLDLGDINEPKGLNGEYVIMGSNGSVSRVPRDEKAFGYIVYYNILKNESGSGGASGIIESGDAKARVKVTNKDLETGESIGGAEFDVYSNMGFKLSGPSGSVKINENGEGLTELLPQGEYYLVQTKSSSGYAKDEGKIPFEVMSGEEMKPVDILSSCMAPVKIFNFYTEGGIKKPIEGARFKLYSFKDLVNELEVLETDASGYATSKPQPYGRYFIEQEEVGAQFELLESSTAANSSAKRLDTDGAFIVEIENMVSGSAPGSGVVEISEDDIPLSAVEPNEPGLSGAVNTGGGAEALNSQSPAGGAVPVSQGAQTEAPIKNNPTTGDNFSITHFLVIAVGMVILLGVRFYLSKGQYKMI